MSRDTVHILVGAAVLLCAPLFFFVFLTEDAHTGSARGYALEARYNRIDGVTIGTDVLLARVSVGKATRLKFNPEVLRAIVTNTGNLHATN